MNGPFSPKAVFSWGSVGFCEVPWILRGFLVGLMGPGALILLSVIFLPAVIPPTVPVPHLEAVQQADPHPVRYHRQQEPQQPLDNGSG